MIYSKAVATKMIVRRETLTVANVYCITVDEKTIHCSVKKKKIKTLSVKLKND